MLDSGPNGFSALRCCCLHTHAQAAQATKAGKEQLDGGRDEDPHDHQMVEQAKLALQVGIGPLSSLSSLSVSPLHSAAVCCCSCSLLPACCCAW